MLCFMPFPLKSNNQKICSHGHSRHETQTPCHRDDPCQCSTSHQVGPHNLEGNLINLSLDFSPSISVFRWSQKSKMPR
jgi:hypothetical protein